VRGSWFGWAMSNGNRIEPHLPTDVRGVEPADDRRVISGIVHVLKSGCRWVERESSSLRGYQVNC